MISLGERRTQVLSALRTINSEITASELSRMMHMVGIFPTADRNNVHPRLNELVKSGLVQVTGKKVCSITGIKVMTYQAREVH